MDFETIKVRLAWFGTEADSWGILSEECTKLSEGFQCMTLSPGDARFKVVDEAFTSLTSALATSTDSDTGTGYGSGAKTCHNIKQALIETSYEYARAEAQGQEWAHEIEKLISADEERRR